MNKVQYYSNNASFSFKILINNLTLFVPDLLYTLLKIILFAVFFMLNFDFIKYIISSKIIENLSNPLATQDFGINSIAYIKSMLISLLIVVVFGALIKLGVTSIKYSMIKSIKLRERVSLKKSFYESKKFLWEIFKIRVLTTILVLIPILLVTGLFASIVLFFKNTILLIVLGILYSLFLITYLFTFQMVFLFLFPTLFLKTKVGAFRTLLATYKYFKLNKMKCFLIVLMVLAISFGVSLFYIQFGIFPLFILVFLIKYFLGMAVNLWSGIFIFENF